MDGKRPGGATTTGRGVSGIPKPSSRLPLPRSGIPTPPVSVRSQQKPPVPSSELSRSSLSQSNTVGSLRNPRLRSTPSRERINPSTTLPRSYRSGGPPVSSQSALKDLSSRNKSQERDSQQRSLQSQQAATDSSFKKPLIPKRRPSSHFSHAVQSSATLPEDVPATEKAASDVPELPPLIQSAEEGLTFDELWAQSSKPRPSLTERTIETLSNLPSSPAVKRRGSNFFDTAGSRRPQSKGSIGSRPGSSYQSDGSNGRPGRSLSRPGSSSGPSDTAHSNFRASTNSYKPPLATVHGTPSKRLSIFGSSATTATKGTPKSAPRPSLNKVSSRASLSATVVSRTTSPEKHSEISVSKHGSKTLAARPLKTRASINGLYKKPSMPSLNNARPAPDFPPAPARKTSLASAESSRTSGEGRNQSSPSTSTAPTVNSLDEPPTPSIRKSSAALRDQIAKAKAAKRAATRQVSGMVPTEALKSPVIPTDNTFDFGLSDDPFGQQKFEDSNRKVMQSRISTARTTGRLNIAAMGLKEIPDEVLKMYDLASIGRSDGTWAESVDLTRLVAADNELETIDDSIFPDIDPTDFAAEEGDDQGRIFWGLESADLHNNMLISLPLGLRRLQLLTSLNLTSNKLTNNCLEVIAQCTSLRDLKLGNNLLYGPIEDSFILENLEILDVHGNNISALPSEVNRMKRLRILNLDENAFESLPFQSLSALPLSELLVRKNKLTGTLIESGVEGLSQLQILDCSGNQLSHLFPPDSKKSVDLPSLHQLTVSMNRLKSLPDMSSWNSILTINADDNNITAFPEGFTSRETLKHAGFSSNDIRIIPPEIARMDSLAMLRITGNPLRDKKFTSLATEELKDALLARLDPLPSHEAGGIENFANGIDSAGGYSTRSDVRAEAVVGRHADEEDDDGRSESDSFATPPTSAPHSPVLSGGRSRSQTLSNQTWPIKPGGILDRSNTQSSSLHPVVCSKIAAVQSVREVQLQHNTFTQFPNSLSFFTDSITSLCISHNQLTGESWLTERLDLTALRELNLQSNYCTSLAPLTTHLCAPNLEKLDVSFNRIVRISALRDVFPSLTVLLISNNRLEELDPDMLRGMKIVDASNNEIAHLNPRLGLLGLERLDVMGNRFRVPRWNVLERGTEATLRWLRGRVPVAEMAEWRAKAGVTEDDSSNEVD
ncbi:L domain-like protein [Xylariaceae sp. FL1651]|nr:L domain-like protein [Xylariaceae sp. FL1651]